ncbi:MAG TPA: carboxymuconolactone decarboxylase family protein [Acidimicrobiales bacterium]|jgi:uncharacterized peroxidase-related enzyme
MSNLSLIDPATASGPAADLLVGVQKSLGVTPNMTKAMAHSPALLQGYVDFNGTLNGGVLTPAVREQIALAVAQNNGCNYCLSAHTYMAEHVAHLSEDVIAAARRSESADAKTAALLAFATAVNDTRGSVTSQQFDAVRAAGANDEEIAETIGHVALNVLTNFFNKAADVAIDFPLVEA